MVVNKMSKKRPSGDQGKELKRRKLLSEVAKGKLPFLTPTDSTFDSLMREKYSNFAHEPSTCIPVPLQEELSWALNTLYYHGYFYRDFVKVKGQTVPTPVSRTLVGEPGMTYKYLGLRLFTIPWEGQPENEVEIACAVIGRLNEHYKTVSRKLLVEKEKQRMETCDAKTKRDRGSPSRVEEDQSEHHLDKPQDERTLSVDEGTDFNVALINYMDPTDHGLRLKPEPYYGMGSLAVSWHTDTNLIRGSSVAVYSQTYSDDGDDAVDDHFDWQVGLKVSWDIETPGVAIPLSSGDSYFMLGNLNDTHQHCVIAGSQSRFSSTHRVADSCKGTLGYIQGRCKEALGNLLEEEQGDYRLRSLDVGHLNLTEAVHNEVEFEWLRQFWMQGTRHATERRSWVPAMEDLEADWTKMEHMTKLTTKEANQDSEEGKAIGKVLLPHLKKRQKLRRQCLDKFSPRLLDTVHPDFLPIHRPTWEEDDPSRPLPFDLCDIISKLRLVCKSNGTHDSGESDVSSDSTD